MQNNIFVMLRYRVTNKKDNNLKMTDKAYYAYI